MIKNFTSIYRFCFGLMALSSVLLIYLTDLSKINQFDVFVLYSVKLFSYFTIQNNILIGLWFVFSAFADYKTSLIEFPFFLKIKIPDFVKKIIASPNVKLALVTYITTVSLVYIILLAPIYIKKNIVAEYTDLVFHYIIPLSFIIDFLFFTKKVKRYSIKHTPFLLIYPIAYAVYILILGSFINWYPYPFIDVGRVSSISVLIINLIGIFLSFIVISFIFIFLGNIICIKYDTID